MEIENIYPDEARWVLYIMGEPGGARPGKFVEAILKSFQYAEPSELLRLETIYPGLIQAWLLAETETGIKKLQTYVKQDRKATETEIVL